MTGAKTVDLAEVTGVEEGDEGKDPTLVVLKSETKTFMMKAQTRKEKKLWAQGLRDHISEAWRVKSKGKKML